MAFVGEVVFQLYLLIMATKQKKNKKPLHTRPATPPSPEPGGGKKLKRLLILGLALAFIFYGFSRALELRWFGDDIFITLRYIRHWFLGEGLIYNPGEWVQGYTHFLWLLLLSLARFLGFNPLEASMDLGLISYLILLGVFLLYSFKLFSGSRLLPLPVTVVALAFHYDFNVWATGGLETMFYTLLTCLVPGILFLFNLRQRTRLLLAGTALLLLMLTRPDGALMVILVNVFLGTTYLLQKIKFKQLIGRLVLLNFPLVMIYLPYLGWKLYYYDSLLPNTYYAKAAYMSHWSQGFIYLWSYFRAYWSSWFWIAGLVPFAYLILSWYKKNKKGWAGLMNDKDIRLFVFLLSYILLYGLIFIARIGGDFMYARFLIPVIPFFYFLIEIMLAAFGKLKLLKPGQANLAAILLTVIIIPLSGQAEEIRNDMLLREKNGKKEAGTWHHINDERYYYLHNYPLQERIEAGRYFRPYFKGLDINILNRGDCCFCYYADIHRVVENFGLTDSVIAHQPLQKRGGRVGHEKKATLEYIEKAGVHFCLNRSFYERKPYRIVYIKPGPYAFHAEMFYYDKPLMNKLKKRFGEAIDFVNIEDEVNYFVYNLMYQVPESETRLLYKEMKPFYFDRNDDPVTRKQEALMRQYLGYDQKE